MSYLQEPTQLTQESVERTMIDEGRSRFWGGVNKAREQKTESRTGYGQELLSVAIEPFLKGLQEWVTNVESKKAGAKFTA